MGNDYDAGSLIDLLPLYYGRLFPGKLMYRWLSYGNPDFFSHREFSFALHGDVYVRYQSFASDEDFVSELKRRKPEKIDIGAVYNQKPKTRDTLGDFIPLQKEFVLDIDLTDYDDVRTCCQGAKVCEKCWKLIAVAVKIMDVSLRKDFGFKNLLWVFSGRRGVHCWVCDEAAINMDSHMRASILDYLTVIRGGENQIKKVKIPNIDRFHPHLSRSVKIIDDVFEEICHEDQNLLENGDKNFEILPQEMKTSIGNSADRFEAVMTYFQNNVKEKKTIRTAMNELKLQLCYPRLDVNVSKDLNHLLKSPFCVHPKTGKVCVPFDPDKAFNFQPSEVPGIMQLLDEINEFDKTQKNGSDKDATQTGGKVVEDFQKTSLAPYMKVFQKFVDSLEKQAHMKTKNGADKKPTIKQEPMDF